MNVAARELQHTCNAGHIEYCGAAISEYGFSFLAMDSRFSGVVKLSNVNDFISASQDCVVAGTASSQPNRGISKEPVKISLQDCLACSGCVTSAETALLENQSSDEFLRKIEDSTVKVAVTISSVARTALAVAYDMSPALVEHSMLH